MKYYSKYNVNFPFDQFLYFHLQIKHFFSFNNSYFQHKMGNGCFTTQPNEVYKKYLSNINIPQLKEKWKAIQLYKIRKIFQSYAVKLDNYNKPIIILQSLRQIFSQFYRYQDKQIQRIYQIFDFENKGCIDWNNFYTFVTICYHASHQTMSLLMFMIFDESLDKRLNRDLLNLLVDFNSYFLRQSSVDHQGYLYDPDDIGQILIPNKNQFLSIDIWLNESHKIFDFEKYRQFFNIFVEVKTQKQLIQNFDNLNIVRGQNQRKYVSYVVDFKWFQLWKSYAYAQYGAKFNNGMKNPNNTLKTLKSFKTKKTLKTLNSIKTQKKIINKALVYHSYEDEVMKGSDQKCKIKNYNLLHSHIGSKPQKMFNHQLQGQFLQVLAPQLVQNMNYVLVSQTVWKKLKSIYQGYPQFRRTGSNNIQLYPKRIKIFSALFKQKLDYSSQIIREVPCYTTVEDLFKDSLEINNLSQKQIFFKTIGMNKWEQLIDFTYMFTEITSEILIFLAYFDMNQGLIFRKNHCKVAQSILEVNLGDQVRYDHPQKNQIKKAIYMGQTSSGKQIIHFKGISHIYDEYLQRDIFLAKTNIIHRNSAPIQDIKISSLDIPIIPIIKSFGFINSLILMLISNSQIKMILGQLSQITQTTQNRSLLDSLINLYKQSKKKSRIQSSLIVDIVESWLNQFVNFQFGMIDECYRLVMQMLDKGLRKSQVRNVLKQDYYFLMVKKIKCLHCSDLNVYTEKCYSLNIQLPENIQKYFQFTFVPFSCTLKSLDIKKYGLKLKSTSTYKQYKTQIGKLIECENFPFVICQVYSNDIIRNFAFVKDETTLEDLNLKQTDNIVVYQLCASLGRFVIDHYTQIKDITHKKFKKGDFIDCKINDDQWVAGKIINIQFMPYTQNTLVKVCHKESITSDSKNQYQLNNQKMAVFPTKSYLYSDQYHIKVIQRCYNETLNEMLPSNIPLVMVLTNWMRCKQFQFMVYQQLKCFIAQNYRFKDVHEFDENDCLAGTNPKFLSYKFSKNQKIKRFKEYLMSDHFPYTISILDINGRCLICHKIHKTNIYKGQSDYYCSGCKLSCDSPITWQIKVHNCMICIDWNGVDRFKKNISKDHKSFTDMIMNKKNDIQRLQKLIEQKLSKKVLILQQQCCNFPYKTTFSQEIKIYPQQLVIQIQRLIETQATKSINRKHINFPFDDLKVGTKMYFLTGVISIQGTNPMNYKNYISNQSQEWFEVHGQTIKKVRKNVVQKCCALFLMYKMKPIQENEEKLSDCRQSQQFLVSQQGYSSNHGQSQGSVRKKNKQLTINQRLQKMEDQEDDFSYLNTQKQDQIQVQGADDSETDSDIPPQRSNSKRQVQYVKDSKQLIKSVSECGKNSQEENQNMLIIRLQKSHQKIGKSSKVSSSSSVEIQQKKRQKITFELKKKVSQSSHESQKSSDIHHNNEIQATNNVFSINISNEVSCKQVKFQKYETQNDFSPLKFTIKSIKSGDQMSKQCYSNKLSSVKSIDLQEITQKINLIELEKQRKLKFQQ